MTTMSFKMKEFIPIHADPEWQELDLLDQKVFCTYRAFIRSEDEVKKIDDYSLSNVLEVASNFASYDLQLRVLSEDQQSLRNQLENFQEDPRTTKFYRSARLQLEAAIRYAQEGDYIFLKHWFFVCQEKRDNGGVIDLDLKEQLERIIQIIPNNTEPFKMASLAWQDPKFDE